MIDRNAVLAGIAEPMERYHRKIIENRPDWWPLEIAAQLLLDGTQFLVFDEVKQQLEKYFPLIHVCDRKTVAAIKSPVTTFTFAAR